MDAASTCGLGIFFPGLDLGFQCAHSDLPTDSHINFLELLAVACAVHICTLMEHVPHRLAVFSDSSFAVDIFSTLRARPPFNSVDMLSVDVLISYGIDLRVAHLAGANNHVADALSRFKNDKACALMPNLTIFLFTPPQDALGAKLQ